MKNFLKKGWPIIAVAVLVISILVWLRLQPESFDSAHIPTLTVETPQKISLSQTEEVTLDVTISDLGDVLYPAMSMTLDFDASKLEFLGVAEGNLCVRNQQNSSGKQLPQWSCNVEKSNETGKINLMYLDMTGGTEAFCKELLAEEYNVVVKLKFRLRGSVRPGDVLDLTVEDAVFAASDETQNLAMTRNTLKSKNGRLVIGE